VQCILLVALAEMQMGINWSKEWWWGISVRTIFIWLPSFQTYRTAFWRLVTTESL
jgi:hypothetical protein